MLTTINKSSYWSLARGFILLASRVKIVSRNRVVSEKTAAAQNFQPYGSLNG